MNEANDFIKGLSDEELVKWTLEVEQDLTKAAAAEEDTNSEWHSDCFAAAVLLTQEMNLRKLKLHE